MKYLSLFPSLSPFPSLSFSLVFYIMHALTFITKVPKFFHSKYDVLLLIVNFTWRNIIDFTSILHKDK